MKILHLIESAGMYGAEAVLLNLVKEQMAQGHEPIILAVESELEEANALKKCALSLGIPVKTWQMKAGFDLMGAWKLVSYARESRVDILHSHGYKFNVLMSLIPIFLRRLPLVVTMHGYVERPLFSKGGVYNFIDRLFVGRANRLVGVSESLRNKILFGGRKKFLVIKNGIKASVDHVPRLDDDVSAFSEKFDFLIGAVGRLGKEKGFDLLLEAMLPILKNNTSVGLLILGEGEERPLLESFIKEHQLQDKVFLAGYRNNASEYMSLFKILVVSSRTEGLPMNMLEAMSSKVPVVATRVGAIPRVLVEGRYGSLVESNNVAALYEGIEDSLKNYDIALGKVESAKRHVESHYSVKQMAENYLDVYQKVLEGLR
jgi:glycosyltransferase involved in cell wall biosynthesis